MFSLNMPFADYYPESRRTPRGWCPESDSQDCHPEWCSQRLGEDKKSFPSTPFRSGLLRGQETTDSLLQLSYVHPGPWSIDSIFLLSLFTENGGDNREMRQKSHTIVVTSVAYSNSLFLLLIYVHHVCACSRYTYYIYYVLLMYVMHDLNHIRNNYSVLDWSLFNIKNLLMSMQSPKYWFWVAWPIRSLLIWMRWQPWNISIDFYQQLNMLNRTVNNRECFWR